MTHTAQQIAIAVAPLINGTHAPSEHHVCDIGYITVPNGTIILRPGYGARANRIDAHYSLTGMREAFGTVTPWPAQPECSFAADKAPERIAADIQRKLIDAAAWLVAQIAAKLAQHASADANALAGRERFAAACPAVRLSDYKPGNYCTDWSIPGGGRARGRVYADSVTFDYVASVPLDKAARIIAILAE